MTDNKLTSVDYWKSLVLYGLNAAVAEELLTTV